MVRMEKERSTKSKSNQSEDPIKLLCSQIAANNIMFANLLSLDSCSIQ